MSAMLAQVVAEALPEDVAALSDRVSAHPTHGSDDRLKAPDMLARFVIARQHNIDQAYAMWESWAEWYTQSRPDKLTAEDVQHVKSEGLASLEGKDKQGRPCIVLRVRHHEPGRWPIEDVQKLVAYCLETATQESRRVADGRVSVVWDHGGAGMRNWDTAPFLKKPGILHVLKDYYPESLHGLYIIGGDWVMRLFIKVLWPFIDERTRHKIHIIEKPEDLLEFVHLEDLPEDIRLKIKPSLQAAKDEAKSGAST